MSAAETVRIKPLQAARLQRMVDRIDWSELFSSSDDQDLIREAFRRVLTADTVPVETLKRIADILLTPVAHHELERDLDALLASDDNPDDDWAA